MNARFACPVCERPMGVDLPTTGGQCPWCDHRLELHPVDERLSHCALCGNAELYRKKDFPHWLGLTILTVACLGFALGHALYRPWWAWSVLIVSAAIDGLLYVWVGDAIVCYRCGAHHGGVPGSTDHKPFELVIAERYRQERIRREEAGIRGLGPVVSRPGTGDKTNP